MQLLLVIPRFRDSWVQGWERGKKFGSLGTRYIGAATARLGQFEKMNRWRGKVAIVTGASAGIGVALVKELLKNDLVVVGIARRTGPVEQIKKECPNVAKNLHPLQVDIASPADIKKGFQWIRQNLQKVHVLINNAGVFFPGTLAEGPYDNWKRMFDVNVLGLCAITSETIKLMKETGVNDGQIININSLTGHYIPRVVDGGAAVNVNAYPSTKHAVTAITEVLQMEMRHTGLKTKVTSLSPGICKTSIYTANEADPETKILTAFPSLEPKDIADAAIYILSTPPHVLIPELMIKHLGEFV